LVEAPGTAPGSATPIPQAVYRHSRLPDGEDIGNRAAEGNRAHPIARGQQFVAGVDDSGVWPMKNPNLFRKFAEHCRRLLRIVTKPEALQQLRIWERELSETADALERRKRRRRARSSSQRAHAE
jgi:hypothetical protein